MKDDRGQASIEAVAFFMTLTVMSICLLGFTKWFLVRQKLLTAVRQGAMFYSSGRMTEAEVRQRLIRFLTTGSPALNQGRISIGVGCYKKTLPVGWINQLDIVKVRYTSRSSWYVYTHLNPVLEEKCIIKHAATYGPGLQPLYGPPVMWLAGSDVSD